MKKLLLLIFAFLIGCISFSSASFCGSYSAGDGIEVGYESCEYIGGLGLYIIEVYDPGCFVTSSDDFSSVGIYNDFSIYYNDTYSSLYVCCNSESMDDGSWFTYTYVDSDSMSSCIGASSGGSSSDISVFYDYGYSSTTISCNGDNSIYINGMASLSGISNFTPFFNISYVDEDNQSVIESYDNDLLYLSGGLYHKTYTGNNQWILNLVGGSSNTGGFNIISSGLVVSGDIVSDNLSGNMFKNFIDTGFTVLFSNVPSYIQYVILIAILIIILRLFTKKRRKF